MYSPETTKYLIHLTLQAEGVVDKPDVVGAILDLVPGEALAAATTSAKVLYLELTLVAMMTGV